MSDEKVTRLYFIDNLRWVMIMLVLSMHAAVTYSNEGGWYYVEHASIDRSALILFVFYQSFLQSFFMGLLFFLAGYFVPDAYDTKGFSKFLKDRAFRLGLPTLFYIFILGPLTEYYISFSWHPDPIDRSFAQEYTNYLLRFRFPGGTGPLWFCAALLLFCTVYAIRRKFLGRNDGRLQGSYFLKNKIIVYFTVAVAVATFLIRIPWPKGTSVFNMQLCYFGQYSLFFMAGTYACRQNWLTEIPVKYGKHWGIAALVAGVLWFPLLIAGGALRGQQELFGGGLHWQSFGLSSWESLVGVSMSVSLIVLFRQQFNKQGAMAKFFAANAFAVYVFHPPILIMIARLMEKLQWNPLIKFPLLTILSIFASFMLSEFLFRRIPVLKNIV